MRTEYFSVNIIFKDGRDDVLNLVNEKEKYYMKPLFAIFKEIPEQIYSSIFNGQLLSDTFGENSEKIITTELTYNEFYEEAYNKFEHVPLGIHNKLIGNYFKNTNEEQ
jgi:hypothetical protein